MEFLDENEFGKRLQRDVLEELIYFARHLTFKDRDERAVILIGHLLIEEQLAAFVHRKLKHPEKISRFTFAQYLQLAEALNEHTSAEWIFSACRRVNSIRNRGAHLLNPGDTEALINEFTEFVSANGNSLPQKDLIDCNLSSFRLALLSVYASLRSLNRDYLPRLKIPTLLSGLLIPRSTDEAPGPE